MWPSIGKISGPWPQVLVLHPEANFPHGGLAPALPEAGTQPISTGDATLGPAGPEAPGAFSGRAGVIGAEKLPSSSTGAVIAAVVVLAARRPAVSLGVGALAVGEGNAAAILLQRTYGRKSGEQGRCLWI